MKRYLLLFLFGLALSAGAQTGTITDSETGQPVPFAFVYYPELNQGEQADEAGRFAYGELQSSRRLRVQVTAIGYDTYVGQIDAGSLNPAIRLLPGHLTLREVVVSAPASSVDGAQVMRVERLSRVEMEAYVPVNLTEGLRMIPGVEMISTGTGIGKPVIRGMSGNRIATYLHGVRIENQQWGPDHGLGLGTLGVEAVEVIKGPASLLYGPDAIGGVLYLIDERFAESGTYSAYAETGFLHNSQGTHSQAGIRLSGNRLSLNVAAGYDNYADYAVPSGDRVLNSRFSGPSLTSSLGYRGKRYSGKLRYSMVDSRAGLPGTEHHHEEEHEGEEEHEEEEAEWFSDSVSRQRLMPDQRNVQHHLASEHSWFLRNSKVDVVAGWSANRRDEFEENPDTASLSLDLDTYTLDARWSTDFSDQTSLILGARIMHQENENAGEERLIPDANQSNYGVYGVLQQRVRKVLLQAGLRMDHSNFVSLDSIITVAEDGRDFTREFNTMSYSIGASAPIADKLELKFSLSGGYRAPNGYELASDGVHHGAIRYERGNADLEAENALQADLAVLFGSDHLEFSVEPFASMVSDYIYLEPTDEVVDEYRVFQYVNADVVMYGGEGRIHWHPHFMHNLHMETTSSFVRAAAEDGQPLPLIPAFRQSSVVRAELGGEGDFFQHVFLGHTWRAAQGQVAELEMQTPEYHLFDAGAAFQLSSKNVRATLTCGVRNLLNRRYTDHLSRLRPLDIPNEGMRVFASLRIDLHGKLRGQD